VVDPLSIIEFSDLPLLEGGGTTGAGITASGKPGLGGIYVSVVGNVVATQPWVQQKAPGIMVRLECLLLRQTVAHFLKVSRFYTSLK
jgi:hypothetical protein